MSGRRFPLLVLLAAVALATPAGAVGPGDLPAAGGSARVVDVIDGDTVVLEDGRQVRLVGLQAPKLPLGRPGFEKWPLAERSRRVLEDLVGDRIVDLAFGGRRRDRYGRLLAHLFLDGATWVQGEMLSRGMARVHTFADNRALAVEMYARERQARAARRGIWGYRFYTIRTPEESARAIDSFQIVEGRVLDAAKVKGRVYLNFGPDWRTDFTVLIRPRVLKLFRDAGIDPLAFEGRPIRVRGWLKRWNGPMIEATHPEQIEIPGNP